MWLNLLSFFPPSRSTADDVWHTVEAKASHMWQSCLSQKNINTHRDGDPTPSEVTQKIQQGTAQPEGEGLRVQTCVSFFSSSHTVVHIRKCGLCVFPWLAWSSQAATWHSSTERCEKRVSLVWGTKTLFRPAVNICPEGCCHIVRVKLDCPHLDLKVVHTSAKQMHSNTLGVNITSVTNVCGLALGLKT